jgi:iron complex outermembrane receptor protein
MLKPGIRVHLAFSALAFILAASLTAQPSTGKISGVVRITGGNPAVGATVTVTNQDTRASRVARAAAGGSYEVTDLPAGVYSVTVELQGFRKATQGDRRLAAGGAIAVDFTLEVKVTEEVTVTAMKRETTVFDTPVSITAPTEDQMREQGMMSLEDVSRNVANFTVQNLGPGQSEVAIRGTSAGQIARDQPGVKEEVGTYLDESSISLSLFNPDIDLFDMNRIEVLRGPQGSLFGSGSVGGAVRFITNQPQLGVSSVFGEVGGETIDGGGTGGNVKVGFNAPLGSMAAVRVAGYYTRLAGWMDAVHPYGSLKPGEFSVEKNVNSGDRMGLRIAFDLAPDEHLTITPRFVYQKLSMEGWNRIDNYNILANPFTTTQPAIQLGPRQLFTQIPEPTTDKFQLGDLDIKYKFDNDILLTSITSFTNRSILVIRDATALTGSVTGGSLGLPASFYTLDAPLHDATQASGWTQEVRLSGGAAKDRFQWVVGGFYGDTKRAYQQTLPVKGFDDLCQASCPAGFQPGGNIVPIIPTQGTYAPKDNLYWSDLHYKLHEYALFGEGTFNVTQEFSLTAGLRYYNYKTDKTLIFDGLFAPLGLPAPPVATVQSGEFKSDGVAPRFIASYKVTDSTTINAQASKGFRLGGLNDPILLPLCSDSDKLTFGGHDTWKDETVWNYELGVKSRFMGGKGYVNATGFYVDIKDMQVVVTAGGCSSRLVLNAPKARSVGGELEFGIAPTEHLDFSASGSYTDAKFTETLPGPEAGVIGTGIRDGNRLPSVPKFQMALAATYQQPIVPEYQGYATANYQHVGNRYTQAVDQEPGSGAPLYPAGAGPGTFTLYPVGGPLTQTTFTFNPLLPAYDIVNLRLGVRHGIWDVAFYVTNLTDVRALLALDRERGLRARQGFLTNQPRTFGLSTRVDF